RARAPRAETLKALARVLEVPASYLLEALDTDAELDAPAHAGPGFLDDGPPAGYVAVPTLEVRPGMGGAGYADDDLMGPPALFPEQLVIHELRGEALDFLAIDVEGPSMEPVLQSGDRILIDRRKVNPSQAGAFALWDGFGLVVKWVERIHDSEPPKLRVMSENERFSQYEVLLEEARIIGRVVWFARRF
ncbi:MAG TPA: S24 family peptidase, partial [Phycisphaerae bacterium]|nr:S24 family peptidase [Phycisphaerae bacterium]